MTSPDLIISASFRIPAAEIEFRTSRSGGPGGQNVNKLETRVELIFDIAHSACIPDQLRPRLLAVLAQRLDETGTMRITVQQSRSQWQNKQIALEKLAAVLRAALIPRKKRVATKPTSGSRERRLGTKKRRGELKRLRKRNSDDA